MAVKWRTTKERPKPGVTVYRAQRRWFGLWATLATYVVSGGVLYQDDALERAIVMVPLPRQTPEDVRMEALTRCERAIYYDRQRFAHKRTFEVVKEQE